MYQAGNLWGAFVTPKRCRCKKALTPSAISTTRSYGTKIQFNQISSYLQIVQLEQNTLRCYQQEAFLSSGRYNLK